MLDYSSTASLRYRGERAETCIGAKSQNTGTNEYVVSWDEIQFRREIHSKSKRRCLSSTHGNSFYFSLCIRAKGFDKSPLCVFFLFGAVPGKFLLWVRDLVRAILRRQILSIANLGLVADAWFQAGNI